MRMGSRLRQNVASNQPWPVPQADLRLAKRRHGASGKVRSPIRAGPRARWAGLSAIAVDRTPVRPLCLDRINESASASVPNVAI
jgi:hypothetical protein